VETDIQEQACWLLLTFESGLNKRIINEIIEVWCVQLGRTLREFFVATPEEWQTVCNLNEKMVEKLKRAQTKLTEQVSVVEQLERASISMLTMLDDDYPKLLKATLSAHERPPVLCYAGDRHILDLLTIAIIGSRKAGETSLAFTREVARYLTEQGANVISGNARGVDRAAYEGATSTEGCTTVVLPHGIRKLSKVQMQEIRPKIEAGNVLLLSQFHPDACWLVSRAMERNKVVTGLAQVVIVAEAGTKGGTWEGANGALRQHRPVYVCQTEPDQLLPGNSALIERGGRPLYWTIETLKDDLSPLLEESEMIYKTQDCRLRLSQQLLLLLKEHPVGARFIASRVRSPIDEVQGRDKSGPYADKEQGIYDYA